MQVQFDSFRTFNFQQANVHLWVFKKSSTARKYTAYYVRTEQQLVNLIKGLVAKEINRITEFSAYSYVAQNNENSCLATEVDETDFSFLKLQVDRPEPEHEVRGIKDLKGSDGYVVKFSSGGETIYAVKRSAATWKTSYPKKFINMVFRDGELAAVEDNAFSIERNFDFYCKGQYLFIANKRGFESALEYKAAYSEKYDSLQNDQEFCSLFTDLEPLRRYVGNNSIQIRRMAVVEQKRIYSSSEFLIKLGQVNSTRNWGLNFDPATNKIIPCDDTAKIILQVLLDHRLLSEITSQVYDVPDATKV